LRAPCAYTGAPPTFNTQSAIRPLSAEITRPPKSPSATDSPSKSGEMLEREHPQYAPRRETQLGSGSPGSGRRAHSGRHPGRMKPTRRWTPFESVQEKGAEQLEAQKQQEIKRFSELDRVLASTARASRPITTGCQGKERFFAWRLKKQEEEQKIADAVSYFVADIRSAPARTRYAGPGCETRIAAKWSLLNWRRLSRVFRSFVVCSSPWRKPGDHSGAEHPRHERPGAAL